MPDRRGTLLSLSLLPAILPSTADAAAEGPFALALSTGGVTEPFLKDLEFQGARRVMDGEVAALLTGSIPSAIQSLGLDPEQKYQLTFSKLRLREFQFYRQQYQDKLPLLPDLSDYSGGLSNAAFFNFVSYMSWKSMCLMYKDDEVRGQIALAAGGIVAEGLLGKDRLDRYVRASAEYISYHTSHAAVTLCYQNCSESPRHHFPAASHFIS